MNIYQESYNVWPKYLNNLSPLDLDDLPKYLAQIGRLYDIEQLVNQDFTSSDVVEYYERSAFGYNLFHSKDNLHMALNFDGRFDTDGYYGQARIIQEYLQEVHPQHVLELASGKGFNSRYLADHNRSDIQFIGIDLTPLHVRTAQERAKSTPNLHFGVGDYHQLNFRDSQFDLVFIIESLCYATDMRQALSEIHRVLKSGGRLIVIAGFRKASLENFGAEIQTAALLVEKTMAVSKGMVIDEWTSLAHNVNFNVLTVRDASGEIMPNLIRFHMLAKAYFKFLPMSKSFAKITGSSYLIGNTIAGLLLPYTVSSSVHGYYIVTLECK